MSLDTFIKTYFSLPDEHLSKLKESFKKEILSKDDFFSIEGKQKISFSYIETGYLRIYKPTIKKEVTQWISSNGELVTDLSALIFGTSCVWNIQAITPVTLYSLSYSDYHKLKEHIPNWEFIEKQFLAKCFLVLEQRVFSFLSMTAEERYYDFIKNKIHLFNEVPHHYIASLLGMTPETLSRIRKKNFS